MPYGYPNQNQNWAYNNPNTAAPFNSGTTWMQNQVPQPPVHISEVYGKDGAQAYNLPPNSSTLLLDKTDSVVWLKTTDDGGFPTLNKFYITPAEQVEQAQKESEYKALENRLQNIENQYAQLQGQYNQIEERLNNNGKSYTPSYAAKNGSGATSNSKQQSNGSSN